MLGSDPIGQEIRQETFSSHIQYFHLPCLVELIRLLVKDPYYRRIHLYRVMQIISLHCFQLSQQTILVQMFSATRATI